jgi:glycine oxidase
MLATLVERIRNSSGDVRFEAAVPDPVWMAGSAGEIVIDCRGIAARSDVSGLRGVRGEMAVVKVDDVRITRPVRLLHPRFPIYVVPWGEDLYMVGATSIESEYAGPVTIRSAIELLASAFALHPAFADARIVELSAGIRPAFSDNIPKVLTRGRRLIVNGTYRHGFLLAPVLAQAVANHLESGEPLPAALTLSS